jgi:hypothetical protein
MDDLRELVKCNNYKEEACLADGDLGFLVPIEDIIKQCKHVCRVEVIDDSDHELLKTLFSGNTEHNE